MADVRISELPSTNLVGRQDIVPIVQDGSTKRVTVSGFLIQSENGLRAYTNGEVATLSGYVDQQDAPLYDFREWNSSRTYALHSPIFYEGVPYRSKQDNNLNRNPETDLDWWEVTGGGGATINGTSAVTASGNTVLAYNSSGQFIVADRRYEATATAVGFAKTAVTSGFDGQMLSSGSIVKDLVGLTPGQSVFLGIDGAIVQDTSTIQAGEYRVHLGVAISNTELIVSVEEPLLMTVGGTNTLDGVGIEAFWPANLSAPGGWLKEDGSAISRTVYSDLFSIIGTTYGIGDGSTTFNLPTVSGGIIRYIPWTTLGGVDQVTIDKVQKLEDFREWKAGETYALNEPVFYNGVPYRSLISGNFGNMPDSSPAAWEVTGGGANSSTPGIFFYNGSFESSTAGWATYKDAAQATPVDGSGGAASITFTRTTSTPLIGKGSGLLEKDAADRQGEGVSGDFAIDRGLLHNPIRLEFKYETSANYDNGYIGVFLYDVINSSFIPTSVADIPSSNAQPATFITTFIPSSNSTSYRLIFHVATSTTTAWTFKIDDIQVTTRNITVGAAIGEWVEYPLVIGAVTTAPTIGPTITNKATWRRVGSNVEIKIALETSSSGTAGSGDYLVSLPSGITFDLTKVKIGQRLGISILGFGSNPAASTTKHGLIEIYSATQFRVLCQAESNLQYMAYWSSAFFNLDQSTISVYIDFSAPVSGWGSNTNLATDFQEFAFNTSETTTTDTTSFGYGPEGAAVQAFAPTGNIYVLKRVRFNRPILSTDLIILEFKPPTVNGWRALSESGFNIVVDSVTSPTITIGAKLIYTSDKEVDVRFYSKADANSTWDSLNSAGWRWRVRKISNGNMAEVVSPWPIGSYYTQYPAANSNDDAVEFPVSERPATLFGGYWEEQWPTESVFFRTRGTLSEAERVDGLQNDVLPIHSHALSNRAFYSGGGSYNAAYTPSTHIDANNKASEVVVRNRRIKVWRRIA